MSGCVFDADSGRLRLDRPCLIGLARLAAAEEAGPLILDRLERGGLTTGGTLDPRLLPMGRCLSRPLVRLQLDHGGHSAWRIEGWSDERVTVLVRSDPSGAEEAHEVVVVPRAMTAFRLAHALKLGPRPRLKPIDPLEIDDGLLEALLVEGDGWTAGAIESLLDPGDQVLPEWLEVLARLAGRPHARWRAGVWWNSSEESPAARLLEIVESEAGSFLVVRRRDADRSFRRARLYPLTATQIWRLLCALLPPVDAVVEPLRAPTEGPSGS